MYRIRRLRDLTDLPVEPEIEQELFLRYGNNMGANILDVDSMSTDKAVDIILAEVKKQGELNA